MQEMQRVWSLGPEDSLEEKMATHFSILACRIPWIEEPGYRPWGLWVSDMMEWLSMHESPFSSSLVSKRESSGPTTFPHWLLWSLHRAAPNTWREVLPSYLSKTAHHLLHQRPHGGDVDDLEVVHVDGAVHVNVLPYLSEHTHQGHVGLPGTLEIGTRRPGT